MNLTLIGALPVRRTVGAVLVVALAIVTVGVPAVGASARRVDPSRVVAPLVRPDAPAALVIVAQGRGARVATQALITLPAGIAAAEGRILLPAGAGEVLGVVAPGDRHARTLPLRPIAGGVRFGVYGLDAARRGTLAVVVVPAHVGPLRLRVIFDVLGGADGRRVVAASGGVAPRTALATPRDVLRDGRLGVRDVAAVRAAWIAGTDGERCRDAARARTADANEDGCLDILDLQSLVAASGTRVGPRPQLAAGASRARRTTTGRHAPAGRRNSRSSTRSSATAGLDSTFTVTSPADTPDVAPGDGLCADAGGACTLRAAIAEADALAGDDRILFALAGTAPVTIHVGSPLPIISSPLGSLEVDGYSQPGSRVNTATVGSNAIPGVELRGAGAAVVGYGLYISSGGNTVRGLVIDGVRHGIFIDGAGAAGNRVVGDWLGTTRTGKPATRGEAGIVVNTGATDTIIGGADPADRNIIGRWKTGIDLYGEGVRGTVILGNDLCMGASGFTPATCNTGIDLNFGPQGSTIGGTAPGERNVVGPTRNQAVELSHAWDPQMGTGLDPLGRFHIRDNAVVGNWLGFRGDGSYRSTWRSGLGGNAKDNGNGVNLTDGPTDNLVADNVISSAFDGIQLMIGATQRNTVRDNRIGRSPTGTAAPLSGWGIRVRMGANHEQLIGDWIAHAKAGGVGIFGSTAQEILVSRLVVSATRGLAIDLIGHAGPDANDPGDTDTGPNRLLNTPVITLATTALVSGTGHPGATVEVSLASRKAGLPGLPSRTLGAAVVGPDGTWTLPVAKVRVHARVTALQWLPDGSTSELSRNRAVATAP